MSSICMLPSILIKDQMSPLMIWKVLSIKWLNVFMICFVEWGAMRVCYLDHVTKWLPLTQISVIAQQGVLRRVYLNPATSYVPWTGTNREVCHENETIHLSYWLWISWLTCIHHENLCNQCNHTTCVVVSLIFK